MVCGQGKYDRNPIKQKFNIVPPATKPLEIVHIDLLSIESEKYLTIIDVFSKYGQAYHLRDDTAISVIQGILHYSTHHGLPINIISDNGPEFNNQVFTEFLSVHNINHHKTLPHCPNDNGNVERFHSTILEHLRLLRIQRKDEPVLNLIPYAIIAYNNSVHSFTKCRPCDIISGHFDL
jgi:transposase InsO family protein